MASASSPRGTLTDTDASNSVPPAMGASSVRLRNPSIESACSAIADVTSRTIPGRSLPSTVNESVVGASGAVEVGADHYPLMITMHAAWLVSLWLLGTDQEVDPWLLSGFVLLQGLRWWVLATLGPRWTTRIIILPGAPLVTDGPYRYISHPNYLVVAAEIALLPLALHLPLIALIFSGLNAAVLVIRIRAESEALSGISRSQTA